MDRPIILPIRNVVREAAQMEAASEDLGVARCPLCDAPMRVRLSREGPRFVCACEETARKCA